MTEYMVMVLVWLYQVCGNNLAFAITIFTVLVRFILLPLALPMMKTQAKMKTLQPELALLKKKHKDDAKAFQTAQLELYSKHNVNPLGGCIPQLAQIGFFILLYQALTKFIQAQELYGVTISTKVWGVDLGLPDSSYILIVLVVLSQLFFSVMIAPGAEQPDIIPNDAKSKKLKKANEKEEDSAEMAQAMQQYMLYILPIMTGVAAISFPAGMALYWIVNTLFSIGQQWVISGPGGIAIYTQRIVQKLQQK